MFIRLLDLYNRDEQIENRRDKLYKVQLLQNMDEQIESRDGQIDSRDEQIVQSSIAIKYGWTNWPSSWTN